MLSQQSIRRRLAGTGFTAYQISRLASCIASDAAESVYENLVFVSSKDDLPEASGGVIQLGAGVTYYILGTVDLEGSRIVAGANTALIGNSSENSRLKSTGLTSEALISSAWSLPLRNLSIEAQVALDLDATGNADQALDWAGVNFINCATVGTIKGYNNFVATLSAFINASGLTFDGTIATVSFDQSIFTPQTGGTALILPNTLEITRRFRITYSAFVIASGQTGINVSASATIPVEGYILDTVNFQGAGTYLTGVQPQDNKALFSNNKGVANSAEIAYYTMNSNVTATTISATNTPVKAAGTTTGQSITQKFTNSNNRATYTGAISRTFKVSGVASVISGNTNQIGVYIAKNGVPLDQTELYVTTNGAGRAEGAKVQGVIDLATNDYVEIFVENNTGTNNVTVADLSVIVESLN